ncbi:MAG TPA: thiamine pyrophosphate-binding protein [Caulobacteraceae bacterium]|jgi:acetolactate synthase-1/2/3 large subunit|nr:thiamine pyrophosphate-binding protein [Caulobacteraceae bacterium]
MTGQNATVAADEGLAMDDGAVAAKTQNGGALLVCALQAQGVDRVFCVPGESYLTVLDALYDTAIDVVSARHEGAAANMAEADGKLTGRPGICLVTRGPGATHASIGVHTAFQDSTPMILFIGQVGSDARDREGFQEVDFKAMFGPLAKWVAEIDDAARIPEYVARAYRTALSGRPGPVVLSLPENMLSGPAPLAPAIESVVAAHAAPRAADLAELGEAMSRAQRPLIVVGGSGWTAQAARSLARFAQRAAAPIVSSFRRQDVIDNAHPNYAGHMGLGIDPSLAERVRSADLVVAVGSRLGENTTSGYTLLTPPAPRQDLIHIHPDANELGRVYQPRLAIACSGVEFALALDAVEVSGGAARGSWVAEAHAAFGRFSTPPEAPAQAAAGGEHVDLGAVVRWLSETLEDDALIANGAGNYTVWVHRFFRYRGPRTELAPTSGAMGYGVPAAIAGKLRHPQKQVVAFAGDGCFLMYPQELATAVQHHANLVILVVDNAMYGTIRMHQERRFPGRTVATDLVNPDFVALAKSFGAHAERVDRTSDFAAAFGRATAAGRPALLHLKVDPAQISPTMRIAAPA